MTALESTTAVPDANGTRPRSRGGLLLPLVLIALGAAFLAANLGYLPPISLRAIFSLWPILLIVGGIEILFARRRPFVALVLQLLVIGLGVALAAAQPAGLFASAGTPLSSESVSRDGATSLALGVSGGAGDFTVSGGASELVEARATGGDLRVRTERRAGRVEVDIDDGDGSFPFGHGAVELAVVVASDVPAALEVSAGAGDVRVDMRSIVVTGASVEAGAGDITVVLPAPRGDVPVRVESGAAEIVIEVPDGVEARVTVSGGAFSLDSDNGRLRAEGGTAQTSGYASATDRVTVTVEAGAASVHIR